MSIFRKKKPAGDFQIGVQEIIDYLYNTYGEDIAKDQFISSIDLHFNEDLNHVFWVRNKKTGEYIRSVFLDSAGTKPSRQD